MKSKLIIAFINKHCQALKLKGKSKHEVLLTTELIEQKALERVMPLARAKTKEEICQDCRDRRCLIGRECKTFELFVKVYAWDMIVTSAELN